MQKVLRKRPHLIRVGLLVDLLRSEQLHLACVDLFRPKE